MNQTIMAFGDCDRCVVARALYRVTTPAGDLFLCGHDFHVNETVFLSRGYPFLGPGGYDGTTAAEMERELNRIDEPGGHEGCDCKECAYDRQPASLTRCGYCTERPVAWIKWRTIGGSGSKAAPVCGVHLYTMNRPDNYGVCPQVTMIPGRSS